MEGQVAGGNFFKRHWHWIAVVIIAVVVIGIGVGVYFAVARTGGEKETIKSEPTISDIDSEKEDKAEKDKKESDVTPKKADRFAYLKDGDIHVVDLDGSNEQAITNRGDLQTFTGSNTGDRWAYLTTDQQLTDPQLFVLGPGERGEMLVAGGGQGPWEWGMTFTPDANSLVFARGQESEMDEMSWEFSKYDMRDGSTAFLFNDTTGYNGLSHLSFNPNGKELYYTKWGGDPGGRWVWRAVFSDARNLDFVSTAQYLKDKDKTQGTTRRHEVFSDLTYSSSGEYRLFKRFWSESVVGQELVTYGLDQVVETVATGKMDTLFGDKMSGDIPNPIKVDFRFSPTNDEIIYYVDNPPGADGQPSGPEAVLCGMNHVTGEGHRYISIPWGSGPRASPQVIHYP